MIIAIIIGLAICCTYMLWVFYLAVMLLAAAKETGKLPAFAMRLGYPLLAAGYILDFAVNIFILSWLLFEVPKELLVTARLSRHIKSNSGYRKNVSVWICKNMLDFADHHGCHCR